MTSQRYGDYLKSASKNQTICKIFEIGCQKSINCKLQITKCYIMRLDLVTHGAVCFGLTLALLPFAGLVWAAVIVLLIGIGKETYDCYKPNPTGFDMLDLAADVVGILIASAVHAVTCLILNFPII